MNTKNREVVIYMNQAMISEVNQLIKDGDFTDANDLVTYLLRQHIKTKNKQNRMNKLEQEIVNQRK